MKATELFNEEMTPEEAGKVFFREYKKCETVQELEELKAAFKTISSLLLFKERQQAYHGWM